MQITRTLLDLAPPRRGAPPEDPCQTHARVTAMLAGAPPTHPTGRVLWAKPRPDRLLVQSPTPMDTRFLPPGYHRRTRVAQVRLRYQPGTRLRWAAIVNPTRDTRVERTPPTGHPTWTDWERHHPGRDHRRATRVRAPITDPEAIRDWAIRHLRGLAVTDLTLHRHATIRGRRRDQPHPVSLHQAHLTGTAIVDDGDQLARLLATGCGHGRSYGCGLVTVVEETT